MSRFDSETPTEPHNEAPVTSITLDLIWAKLLQMELQITLAVSNTEITRNHVLTLGRRVVELERRDTDHSELFSNGNGAC